MKQDADIDYENKSGSLTANPMQLLVRVEDIEPFIPDYFWLQVEIFNVNDENSTFVHENDTVNVTENSSAGEQV